jgi:hypothetical protein
MNVSSRAREAHLQRIETSELFADVRSSLPTVHTQFVHDDWLFMMSCLSPDGWTTRKVITFLSKGVNTYV